MTIPLTHRRPGPAAVLCRLAAVLLAGWAGPCPAAGAAEVRGTWLTTTGVDHIASGRNTAARLQTIHDAGLNTAYIEAWKAGYTQFPSATMQSIIGFDRAPSLGTRDLIDEAVLQAHRNNMAAVAWFEYGFSSNFGSATNPLSVYANNRGWLLRDINGGFTNAATGFVWMNPAVPEVRQLLIDVVVEAVRDHDLDGIQFDDRLAWPRSLGYDATTNAILNQRFGVNITPTHPSYTGLLNQLQDESLDQFVAELHTAVRAVDPGVWISLAPSVNGFSQQNYTADWPKWVQQGYFDEVVPQVYRSSIASFNSSLPGNVSPFTSTGRAQDGIMGLRFNGSGGDTPLADVLAMITATRNAAGGQLGGHSIWYSDNVVDFASSLAAFYGGWESSPNLEPGQRPDPRVGSFVGAGSWGVNIDAEGLYRVVGQYDGFGRWRTVDTVYLRTGDVLLNPGVVLNQLELLRDRRPLDADYNDSGLYEASDLDAIYGAIGLPVPDPVFDLDGNSVVDLADVLAWATLANTDWGDFNLDGELDLTDAMVLRDAYSGSVAVGPRRSYGSGNLDGDADVDFEDAMLFRRLFLLSGAEPAALDAVFATIPEPGVVTLLLGALGLGLRPGCCHRTPRHAYRASTRSHSA